jgi:aspartate racemase
MNRKRIGIIGGLSPESTILYYKTIIEEYRRRFNDEHYPEIIIYSIDFEEFTRAVDEGRDHDAIELLMNAINRLAYAGVDFAIISANTPHKYFNILVKRSPIPILSIIDALAESIIRDGLKRIGLLGTKYTLTQGFYAEGLRRYGIEAIIPDREDIELVNNIIYEELVKGIIRDSSRRIIYNIIDRLIANGAEGVALACTELPLIVRQDDLRVKIYDTARIHAIKALEYALG